jgi:hypothetical protein
VTDLAFLFKTVAYKEVKGEFQGAKRARACKREEERGETSEKGMLPTTIL